MNLRLLIVGCTLSGCTYTERSEHITSTGDNPLGTFEEFRARTYREPWPAGKYIVEGDVAIPDDAGLFDYWESFTRGALTVYNTGSDVKWSSSQKLNLTYCINNSFGANTEAMSLALRNAGWEWERRGNVKFIHVTTQDGPGCTASNHSVMFNVRQVNVGGQYAARAFFPDESRSGRELLVNAGTLGNTPRNLIAVMGHEFGHILGFRHEFVRPEDMTSCGSGDENDNDWRALTSYDPRSIMTYPGCGFDWWTSLDRDGVSSLYGSPATSSSDILWRCVPQPSASSCGAAPSGSTAIWNEADAAMTSYPGAVGFDWQIAGVGDFDGNGKRDILWRSVNGDNVIWPSATAPGYWISPAAPGWRVVGIGDFDGNGKSDILWRDGVGNNVIWTDANAPGHWIAPVSTAWNVAGIGDFNGNGKSDILWRSSGGSNAIWTDAIAPGHWIGALDHNWSVGGIGDFDDDGFDDILWRSVNGDNVIWPSATGPGTWITALDTGWTIVGIGDFDANGKSDILWRRANGENAVWHDGSATWTSWLTPLDTNWRVAGVGDFIQ